MARVVGSPDPSPVVRVRTPLSTWAGVCVCGAGGMWSLLCCSSWCAWHFATGLPHFQSLKAVCVHMCWGGCIM